MEDTSASSPMAIQVAVQGGGAKICALFAVMEALQQLEDESEIRVTRLAGTSAGAIAASLFAAGVPMKMVRRHLLQMAEADRKKVFPTVGGFMATSRLLRNRPIWPTRNLKRFLEDLFALDGNAVQTFGDIEQRGRKLRVMATDVTNAQPHVYADPSTNVINALLDSAAIPFFYRTWSSTANAGTILVDGGICENLPSHELEKLEVKEPGGGLIIAVAFRDQHARDTPTTFLEFSKALLDAAMNSSMLRARETVKRVVDLITPIGTFEFENAFKTALGDSYELIRTKTYSQVKDIVQNERRAMAALTAAEAPSPHVVKSDLWSKSSEWMQEQLRIMYAEQHERRTFTYERTRFVVTANCLLNNGEVGFGTPDLVRNTIQFAPAGEPIFCHRMALAGDGDVSASWSFMGDPSWRLVDARGRQVSAIHMPIKSGKKNKRELLLFFQPPLEPASALIPPFTLSMADWVHEAMGPLKREGKDELGLTGHRVQGTIGRVDLVLFVPERLVKAEMRALPTAHPGRKMLPDELNEYDIPPGFRALGWVGNDVPGGTRFAVSVILSP